MKKIISCFLVTTLSVFNVIPVSAAEKKDVSDPVLREMISALSSKIPKFIDKYGSTVFVADEQITRASLITALYEYDKKRGSSGDSGGSSVSKHELDALNSKIASLERKVASSRASSSSSGGGSVDIIKIMNDLEPNMPMLLDNSLASSKVFRDLQKQVSMGGGSSGGTSSVSSAHISEMQADINSLNAKYNNLVTAMETAQNDTGGKISASKINSSIAVLQKEIAGINVKMSGLQDAMTESNIKIASVDNMQRDMNLMQAKLASIDKGSSKGGASSVSSGEIAALTKEVENIKNKITGLDNSLSAAAKGDKMTSSQLAASVSSLQSDMSNIQNKIAGLTNEVEWSKQNSITANDLTAMNREISNLRNKMSNLSLSSISEKGGKVASSQLVASVSSMQSDITDIQHKMESLTNEVEWSKQNSITANDLTAMNREISNLRNKMSGFDASAVSSGKGGKASSSEMYALNREMSEIKNKLYDLDSSVTSMKKSKSGDSYSSSTNKDIEEMRKTLVQTQKSYVDIAKRINSLENRAYSSSYTASGKVDNSQIDYLESKINSIRKTVEDIPTSDYVKSQISKADKKTSSDIRRIENRLNDLEKTRAHSSSSSDEDSSDGGSSVGTITKVSLGLTMVAALFIAR